MNKTLISTGGTGGHVIPATILYEHLSKTNEVLISTDIRGYKYLNKEKYKIEIINTPRLDNIFLLPFNLIIIFFLVIKSFILLKRKKIDQLFSTGGYMSLPLVLAGKFLNIRIYLLEPNWVLGRANKLFLRYCKKIFCYSEKIKNFPENFKNKIVIINPLVGKEFYNIKKDKIRNGKFNILVVGGSQGANIFDQDLKKSIINLSKKFEIKIIQQTQKKNIFYLKKFYSKNNIENIIFDYDKNFVQKILQSDICITRGGATTLAELSIMKVPFIVVPLPTSKDNHQLANANFYENKNCCWIISQNLFNDKIGQVLKDILKNKSKYLKKKENLEKLNYQNTWNNVNQKIISITNEN